MSEMQRNQTHVFKCSSCERGVASHHRGVGDPVKSIAPDAVMVGQNMRNGIGRSIGWHRPMKSRIKHRDHRHLIPQEPPRFSDAYHGYWIMERRQLRQMLALTYHPDTAPNRAVHAHRPLSVPV